MSPGPRVGAAAAAAVFACIGGIAGAMHFFVIERSTPRRLLDDYVAAASAGDVAAIEAFAPAKVMQERRALGTRYHEVMGEVLHEALTGGALRVKGIHDRVQEAQQDAQREYYRMPSSTRPAREEFPAWLNQQAVAGLNEEERAAVYKTENGNTRTLWNDVATEAWSDWRYLSRRMRESISQEQFLAEIGSLKVDVDKRKALLVLGTPTLGPEAQAALTRVDYTAWLDEPTWVHAQGERLLSSAYQEFYGGQGVSGFRSTAAEVHGLLFRPGWAHLEASAAQGSVTAEALRQGGQWALNDVDDLSLDLLVATISRED